MATAVRACAWRSARRSPCGGIAEGAGNEISWNGGDGVEVLDGADFNPIRGNSIHDNGGLGIDLGPTEGVTENDEFDDDAGGNDEKNFPRILSATFDGLDTLISGDLDSETALRRRRPSTSTRVSSCDDSGNGEGETYLGSFTIPLPAWIATGMATGRSRFLVTWMGRS